MPADPTARPPLRRLALAALVGLLAAAAAGEAAATTWRVRSVTAARAAHYQRADLTVAAPRVFAQGLRIWGYDLLDDQTGSLNAHVALRYDTDFALEPDERSNPYLADDWNDLDLELAYLDWRPLPALHARLGRQWVGGPLGWRDFDGAALGAHPDLGVGATAHLVAYGGQEADEALAWHAPASFDVQGVPIEPADAADDTWLVGGRAGIGWGIDGALNLAWRKRLRATDAADAGDTATASERLGAAATTALGRRVTLTAHGVYNAVLDLADTAGLQSTWAPPGVGGVVSAGVDHRHPWFDSASIFNLFGARPHQTGWASYQRPVPGLRTTVELRGWGRRYPGEPDDERSAQHDDAWAAGAAVTHRSRLYALGRTLRWGSTLSYQADLGLDVDQALADTRLAAPVLWDDLFVTGRLMALFAVPNHPQYDQGWATTGALGVELPAGDYGRVSVATETTAGTFLPAETSVYAAFALEFWP